MLALRTLLAVALAYLCGCTRVTVSLNPLYDALPGHQDPRLVGDWEVWEEGKAENDALFRIAQSPHGRYIVEIKPHPSAAEKADDEPVAPIPGVLVELEGSLFLDLSQEPTGLFGVPAHYIIKLEVEQDRLRAWTLDDTWLKALLTKEPGALAHALVPPETEAQPEPGAPQQQLPGVREDQLVLTASTKSLRAFFGRAAREPNAWGEPAEFRRYVGEP